jgi:hypothetical protein
VNLEKNILPEEPLRARCVLLCNLTSLFFGHHYISSGWNTQNTPSPTVLHVSCLSLPTNGLLVWWCGSVLTMPWSNNK